MSNQPLNEKHAIDVKRIRVYMAKNGLTQTQLAVKTSINPGHLSSTLKSGFATTAFVDRFQKATGLRIRKS